MAWAGQPVVSSRTGGRRRAGAPGRKQETSRGLALSTNARPLDRGRPSGGKPAFLRLIFLRCEEAKRPSLGHGATGQTAPTTPSYSYAIVELSSCNRPLPPRRAGSAAWTKVARGTVLPLRPWPYSFISLLGELTGEKG
jgi:hypothetical protein